MKVIIGSETTLNAGKTERGLLLATQLSGRLCMEKVTLKEICQQLFKSFVYGYHITDHFLRIKYTPCHVLVYTTYTEADMLSFLTGKEEEDPTIHTYVVV